MLSRVVRVAVLSTLIFAEAQAAPALSDLDHRALAELVAATTFPHFGNSTEGAVIARVESLVKRGRTFEVWIHEKGALRKGSEKDLDRAFGANRRHWPPYTILFAVSGGADGKLSLEVHTWYDMGLTPESRGGMQEAWQVEKRAGRWIVVDKEVTLHVD
jgi:sarcosine oxidase delta subunit